MTEEEFRALLAKHHPAEPPRAWIYRLRSDGAEEPVQLTDLRVGDRFRLIDRPGRWRATSVPYPRRRDGQPGPVPLRDLQVGLFIWSIAMEQER
jgi:hypothetical protein